MRGMGPRRPPPRPATRALPPEMRSLLNLAQQALNPGDARSAIIHGRRSLGGKPTTRVHIIMAEAYCLQQDLRLVLGELRRVGAILKT